MSGVQIEGTNVLFEVLDTQVDAFHHIQEVDLQDQRFSGMVQHPGCGL